MDPSAPMEGRTPKAISQMGRTYATRKPGRWRRTAARRDLCLDVLFLAYFDARELPRGLRGMTK
jgi:hypothetical protein